MNERPNWDHRDWSHELTDGDEFIGQMSNATYHVDTVDANGDVTFIVDDGERHEIYENMHVCEAIVARTIKPVIGHPRDYVNGVNKAI